MMRRREFITLLSGAAGWPLAARAQQGERVRRIGVLDRDGDPHSPHIWAGHRLGLLRESDIIPGLYKNMDDGL
jgi:hypothetical protein